MQLSDGLVAQGAC